MMTGKKRLITFESNPESTNSIFQSKRIFEGSSFDVHRAQPSQPQSIGTQPPPLDPHRGELSRQHVRALNTQFASWVQSQLQNHPDELWEDGVQDYLDHASKIKEKFSDVVNWLKSNPSEGDSVFGFVGSQNASKGESVFGLSSQKAPLLANASKEASVFGLSSQNPSVSTNASKVDSVFGLRSQNDASKGESVFAFSSQKSPVLANALNGESVFGLSSHNSPVPANASREESVFGLSSHNSPVPAKALKEESVFGLSSQKAPVSANASKVESVFGLSSQNASVPANASKVENVFGLSSQNAPVSANASKVECIFGLSFQDGPKKPMFESKDNMVKLNTEHTTFGTKEPTPFGAKEQPTFGVFGTTPSPSWSTGFSNQTPLSFGGSPIAAPSNADASNDANGEEEPLQPSSPSVKKTEEKGIIVVHEVKCKLYIKTSDPENPWKNIGIGPLSIKCKEGVDKGTKESKPIIIVRNDVGRILLNASIYSGIKTSLQKNGVVAIFHTADETSNEVVAQTFLIRVKSEDDRNKLASAIQEHAPAA